MRDIMEMKTIFCFFFMKFTILTIGKTKESFVQDGINEYLQKLRPFAEVEFIILPEETIKKGMPDEEIKRKESEKMLLAVPQNSTLVVLDERGKSIASPVFAKEIEIFRDTKGGHFSFCIGGALGHSEVMRKSADLVLSLSPLTFPHDLVRVFLLEQLYRVCMILGRRSYHK